MLKRCLKCNDEWNGQKDSPCTTCGAISWVVLETIHYDPPQDNPDIGTHDFLRWEKHKNTLACDPTKGVAGRRATGVPEVVNCPACKQTAEYLKHATPPEDRVSAMTAGECCGAA